MSAPEGTRAIVLLADFIAVDASGKFNVLGGAFTFTSLQPNGLTSPQSVACIIDFPSRCAGQNIPIGLELRDETIDEVVKIPGPSGSPDALRINQFAAVGRPQAPGLVLPDQMACRAQLVLNFPMGLPLSAGHKYAWKLEIDATRRPGWAAHFGVAMPPQPIIGGLAGPSAIPEVGSLTVEEEESDEGDAQGEAE